MDLKIELFHFVIFNLSGIRFADCKEENLLFIFTQSLVLLKISVHVPLQFLLD